jgi:hypothetical protein
MTLSLVLAAGATHAAAPDENFMLVLREQEGANQSEFAYRPVGPLTFTIEGKDQTVHFAWYGLLGDLVVRFVFDSEYTMQNLTGDEFAALELTPEAAADIAVRNIRARYGAPQAQPWQDGVMFVAGESPDVDSSYFLDLPFWNGVLATHAGGVIACVPERGGLLYAPAEAPVAVAALDDACNKLYRSAGRNRVSSARFLYTAAGWTLHSPPKGAD